MSKDKYHSEIKEIDEMNQSFYEFLGAYKNHWKIETGADFDHALKDTVLDLMDTEFEKLNGCS